MRTLAHCLEHGFKIVIGCRSCGQRRPAPPLDPFYHHHTIEELQRGHVWRCDCGEIEIGVNVYAIMWGHDRQIECWTEGACFVVPVGTDGLEG